MRVGMEWHTLAYMNARISQLPEYAPENWDAQVGQRIKALLIGRATQLTLGSALGLGQTDISKRLSGKVPWKGHELADVAEALGVKIGLLYGDGEDSNGPETSRGWAPSGSNRRPTDYRDLSLDELFPEIADLDFERTRRRPSMAEISA